MKKIILNFLTIGLAAVTLTGARAEDVINISNTVPIVGRTPPIPVSMSGFTGVGAEVL